MHPLWEPYFLWQGGNNSADSGKQQVGMNVGSFLCLTPPHKQALAWRGADAVLKSAFPFPEAAARQAVAKEPKQGEVLKELKAEEWEDDVPLGKARRWEGGSGGVRRGRVGEHCPAR